MRLGFACPVWGEGKNVLQLILSREETGLLLGSCSRSGMCGRVCLDAEWQKGRTVQSQSFPLFWGYWVEELANTAPAPHPGLLAHHAVLQQGAPREASMLEGEKGLFPFPAAGLHLCSSSAPTATVPPLQAPSQPHLELSTSTRGQQLLALLPP